MNKELNEKLAELCGIKLIGDQWGICEGESELWNPTADLNQLQMCYEAAEKAFNIQTPHFTFAGTVFAHLKALLRKSITRVNDVVMPYEMMSAWVKHPELVAQAILKAKEVSL